MTISPMMQLKLASIKIDLEDEDEDFDLLCSSRPYVLSKAQAVRLIDSLHQAVIKANGLPDLDRDYRGLVEEMIREQWTSDAITRGRKRGSRKYGCLPCHRSPRGKNCRVLFSRLDVIEWFQAHIEPELLLKSTHVTH